MARKRERPECLRSDRACWGRLRRRCPIRPARMTAILSNNVDDVAWLDEKNIVERLRMLREDHAAWRLLRAHEARLPCYTKFDL